GSPRVYIATAQAFDAEMREKIENHKIQRGPDWHTIEAITDVATAVAGCKSGQVVLLDCATLWLTNVVLADQDVAAAEDALLAALAACPAQVVVVSNEVGQGIVPDSKLGRAFRNHQGRLNQKLASQAGLVVNVIAGLPQVLKGQLP
ncbi:MAG: bifunctional adenosylcobinamide kinase/adenosylcobinamide-phosphate guanylyltransferase, partial [Octadecabacter sp.]|nr:bifunctional adenosylcobinamide kinase/adenosylcobinamide-phosphate guanylyltransferase [Octadecabacter sp.]